MGSKNTCSLPSDPPPWILCVQVPCLPLSWNPRDQSPMHLLPNPGLVTCLPSWSLNHQGHLPTLHGSWLAEPQPSASGAYRQG